VLAGYVVLMGTLGTAAWVGSDLYGEITASHPETWRIVLGGVCTAMLVAPYPILLWRAIMHRTRDADKFVVGWMLLVAMVLVGALGNVWVMALTAPAALFGVVWTLRAGRAVVVSALLAGTLLGFGLAHGWPVFRTVFYGGYLIAVTFSGAVSLWFCHVVEELRQTRAELAGRAVGAERQRFARDLHDVLGHSLQAVALRAELAERMIEKGSGAGDGHPARDEWTKQVSGELAEIQRVARGAVNDVREVVRGHRATSLRTELEGMTAVLQAAGVRCETPSVPPGLPGHVHEALGWVVRESATNVLRHSSATWCSLRVTVEDGFVRLEIANDGAGGLLSDDQGSGLAGLTERITGRGGAFEAGYAGDGTFRVTADVPMSEVTG
jgi:two-component system sensor histidine kinase DesK